MDLTIGHIVKERGRFVFLERREYSNRTLLVLMAGDIYMELLPIKRKVFVKLSPTNQLLIKQLMEKLDSAKTIIEIETYRHQILEILHKTDKNPL